MNTSSFSERVKIYPKHCEQVERIQMKTDENEYGAL